MQHSTKCQIATLLHKEEMRCKFKSIGLAVVQNEHDPRGACLDNGGRTSYKEGAYKRIPTVPQIQAIVKMYKKRRSITMAMNFQSRSI